ncbi:unnamed protein product, partial [Meganyctiphanes norvegica]
RFAHKLLLEILCNEDTSYPNQKFKEHLTQLTKPYNRTTALEAQYQKLRNIPVVFTYKIASKSENAKFHRDQSVLPADNRVIFLPPNAGSSHPVYINASRVDSLRKKDNFIVTEHPMSSTLPIAWKMVLEKQINVWVLLHTFPLDDEDFPSVLSMAPGILSLDIISQNTNQNFSQFDITVTSSANNQSHTCRVLQLNKWLYTQDLPSSSDSILALLQHLSTLDINSKPLLFSCKNGYSGCGVALALHMILSRMQEVEEVDVYRVVHCIRHSHSQFIGTLEQYEFLYKNISSYLHGYSIYNNMF